MNFNFLTRTIVIFFLAITITPFANAQKGLVADYNIVSKGGGDQVVNDESGNNNTGAIHGATWTRSNKGGFRLKFNGEGDYIDCGTGKSLDLRKNVTVEAWVKPMASAGVDVGIAGKHYSNYALTLYRGRYWWYISGGGNNVNAEAKIGSWQHVVGTFDGKDMKLYVNGKLKISKKSKSSIINPGAKFLIGCMTGNTSAKDPNEQIGGFFNGMVGCVRVYDKAISETQILKSYKDESNDYIDAAKMDKLKVTVYPYFNDKKISVEVDYSSLMVIPAGKEINLQLFKEGSAKPLAKYIMQMAPKNRYTEINYAIGKWYLSQLKLSPGRYVISASLEDKKATCSFDYVDKSSFKLPDPNKKVAKALPVPHKQVKYDLKLTKGGSFSLKVNGKEYPFESSYSYPHGGENKLTVSDSADKSGEKAWTVTTKNIDKNTFMVNAKGKYYEVKRKIKLYPNHIEVKDTFVNRTEEPQGIIIHNNLIVKGADFTKTYLAGFPGVGVRANEYCPSVFVGKENIGIGIIPLDDVYVVQAKCYNKNGAAGVSTDEFALDKKASYTLEWLIYPNGTGDYYDFVNAFRQDEGRIGKVEGQMEFVTRSMRDRNLILNPYFVKDRNLKYAIMPCLGDPVDDPELWVEGVEFVDFPKDMAVIKKNMTEIHKTYPNLQGMFHVAHSLYTTNRPERFKDSRVLFSDGKQAIWKDPDYSYISKKRQDEGWKFWIFYPTPGNSFHKAMMDSVDVMMDELGCRGVFTDGMLSSYISAYTYDKWDGHTAIIDPETKTIKSKPGSVILLSQPSIVEYIRKINGKGGTMIANNCVITRTLANEKIIINREVPGPDAQLAPTSLNLGLPSAFHPDDVSLYRDILNVLDYGSLYFLCGIGPQLNDDSIARRMFPMTFEEIRSGMVRGDDRIVTALSGVYDWSGSSDLSMIYKYNGLGIRVPHNFITTVDKSGARTQVDLKKNETAVLEKIPVSIKTQNPINVSVLKYDKNEIEIMANGHAKADLIIDKKNPTVTIDNKKVKIDSASDKKSSVKLNLNSETKIIIKFK